MSDIPLFAPAPTRRASVASSFNPTALLPHAALAVSIGFVASILFGVL